MSSFFGKGSDYTELLRGGDILGKDVCVEDHREKVLKAKRLDHGDFGLWLICWIFRMREVREGGGGGLLFIKHL